MQWGIKKKEKKNMTKLEMTRRKDAKKCNLEQPIEDPLIEVEEDPVEVPRSSRTFGKYGLQLENFVERDEGSLFIEN